MKRSYEEVTEFNRERVRAFFADKEYHECLNKAARKKSEGERNMAAAVCAIAYFTKVHRMQDFHLKPNAVLSRKPEKVRRAA